MASNGRGPKGPQIKVQQQKQTITKGFMNPGTHLPDSEKKHSFSART